MVFKIGFFNPKKNEQNFAALLILQKRKKALLLLKSGQLSLPLTYNNVIDR